jgi:hypothetical protein
MKKWLIILVIILAVNYYRNQDTPGEDIKQLQPVQTVLAEWTEGKLHLSTDNGCEGKGSTVQAAIADMQSSASGKLFLNTADYLLVRKNALSFLDELKEELRPSCTVCGLMGTVDLPEVAEYLSYHIPRLTVAMYEAGERLIPLLISGEGGMQLVQGEYQNSSVDSVDFCSNCTDSHSADSQCAMGQPSTGSSD